MTAPKRDDDDDFVVSEPVSAVCRDLELGLRKEDDLAVSSFDGKRVAGASMELLCEDADSSSSANSFDCEDRLFNPPNKECLRVLECELPECEPSAGRCRFDAPDEEEEASCIWSKKEDCNEDFRLCEILLFSRLMFRGSDASFCG